MSKLGNVQISKNSAAAVGTRAVVNLVEGANITLTITDDAAGDEIDVTIAAAGGGAGANQIPYDVLLYVSGANYVADQADGTNISTSADGDTVIQAAFDYINTIGGGAMFVNEGNYVCDGNINIPSGERYIIQGVGFPDDRKNPTTSGGSNWHFESGARFTASAGAAIDLINMGFSTESGDTWTDSWIDFFGISPAQGNVVNSLYCAYSVKGIHPAGSATNPKGTPAGIVIAIGRDSGPQGFPYIWEGNDFYDAREDDGGGTNDNNTLLGIKVESLIFRGNFFYMNIPAALTTPNLMYDEPVSYSLHEGNAMFTDAAMSGATQYEHQFMCVGGDKNYYFLNDQLIDTTFMSGAHFTHHGAGTLYVYGSNLFQSEGGNVPYLPTGAVTNSGVIRFRLEGRGWEVHGQAELSDTDTVAHGLLGNPVFKSANVEETDSHYAANFTSDATNLTLALYDIVAGAAETTDKTISYYARYQFDVT